MKNLLTVFLLCFLCLSKSQAQNYFVSMGGNDNDAGDLAHPFATIQRGINAATSAGSNIYVTAGTYTAGFSFQNYAGSSTAPITLKNYNGATVYVDGGGVAAGVGTSMVTFANVSNIVIDGIIFQNAINNQVKGILVQSGCSDITVRNCKFTDIHFSNNATDIPGTGQGTSPFIVYGTSASAAISRIRLTQNQFYNCRTGQSEAVTFNGNVDDFIVDSNLIYDIGNIGIDIAGHRGVCSNPGFDQARNGSIRWNVLYNCKSPMTDNGQIYVDGGRDIIIENNICHDGSVGIVAGCEILNSAANNVTIRNNVVYHNTYSGIQVGTGNSNTENKKVVGTVVSGNTCYDNDYGTGYAGQMVFKYCDSTVVMNNIMASPTKAVVFTCYYSTGLGNKFDYNLYWTPSGTNSTFNYWQNPTPGYYSFSSYQNGTGQDAHAHCINPMFVNSAGNDFHLQIGSPAINGGNPSSVTTGEKDLDGGTRAVGTIDCGADETNYPTAVHNLSTFQGHIYPNPTHGMVTIKGLQNNDVINIISVLGIVICKRKVLNRDQEIVDLSNYPSGIYMVTVDNALKIKWQSTIVKQ